LEKGKLARLQPLAKSFPQNLVSPIKNVVKTKNSYPTEGQFQHMNGPFKALGGLKIIEHLFEGVSK
jgi:hypothetical protein